MGIIRWIAERPADTLFHFFGNYMFQTISFIMHLIPCVAKFFIQEGFEEAVVADNFKCDSLPVSC